MSWVTASLVACGLAGVAHAFQRRNRGRLNGWGLLGILAGVLGLSIALAARFPSFGYESSSEEGEREWTSYFLPIFLVIHVIWFFAREIARDKTEPTLNLERSRAAIQNASHLDNRVLPNLRVFSHEVLVSAAIDDDEANDRTSIGPFVLCYGEFKILDLPAAKAEELFDSAFVHALSVSFDETTDLEGLTDKRLWWLYGQSIHPFNNRPGDWPIHYLHRLRRFLQRSRNSCWRYESEVLLVSWPPEWRTHELWSLSKELRSLLEQRRGEQSARRLQISEEREAAFRESTALWEAQESERKDASRQTWAEEVLQAPRIQEAQHAAKVGLTAKELGRPGDEEVELSPILFEEIDLSTDRTIDLSGPDEAACEEEGEPIDLLAALEVSLLAAKLRKTGGNSPA
jgi:hypothetical protein